MNKNLIAVAIAFVAIFSFFVGISFAMPKSEGEVVISSPESAPTATLSSLILFQKDGTVPILLERGILNKEGDAVYLLIVEKIKRAGYIGSFSLPGKTKHVIFGVTSLMEYKGSGQDSSPLIYWRGTEHGGTSDIGEGMRRIDDYLELPGEIEK